MRDGDPSAEILVIAMAPGSEEMSQGRPLVGPSGNLLWGLAARAGFSRADCFILNTIGEPQQGSSPTDAQYEKYWDEFDAAVASSAARTALVLGGDALWRLTGLRGRKNGILHWRGYLVSPSEVTVITRRISETIPYKTSGKGHKKGDPRTVFRNITATPVLPAGLEYIIPALHPSFVLRSGFRSVAPLAFDVARCGRAHRRTLHVVPVQYETQPRRLGADSTGSISFDIETGGTTAGSAITRIGIDAGDLWTAPWDGAAAAVVRDTLGTDRIKVGHNCVSFDIPRLEAVGVPVAGPVFCTLLAAQMLQPDLPKGLNYVASLYLDTPRWKHKSDSHPAMYNAWDARRTRELYDVLSAELRKTGQYDLFMNTIMPAATILVKLREKGLKVDVRRQSQLRSELAQEEAEAVSEWNTLYPDVSISSNQQIAKLFYDKLGWPVQKDATGKRTVDEAALQRLIAGEYDNHLCPIVLRYRKAHKARKTFVDIPMDMMEYTTHPDYMPRAKDDDDSDKKGMAGTGRIQAKDPNIMQVPKKIRSMYVPSTSTSRLVEFDFDQAELRVVAALSGDTVLRARLDGPDIHQIHATRWGCDRAVGKTVTYGTLYGAGAAKIQKVLALKGVKKTKAECQRLLDSFFGDYPAVAEYRADVIQEVTKTRRLSDAFGRSRYFWNPTKDIPAALDFRCQSTVAGIVWASLKEAYELARSLDGWLLTIVHDSFLFEFPPGRMGVAIPQIRALLERPYDNVAKGFYLPTSHKVGDNWGELVTDEEEDQQLELADEAR